MSSTCPGLPGLNMNTIPEPSTVAGYLTPHRKPSDADSTLSAEGKSEKNLTQSNFSKRIVNRFGVKVDFRQSCVSFLSSIRAEQRPRCQA